MDVDVSLDNVTFVGEWTDWGVVCEYLEDARLEDSRNGVVDSVVARCGRALQNGAMQHQQAWSCDGAYLSNWVELSTLGHSWVRAERDDFAGRIEFNPNKITDRVLTLLHMFEPDHPSRADVALDYLDVPIADYVFTRPRVRTTKFEGPSGYEGQYLGRQSSERFVRIYDKPLEMGITDFVMTRVEGVGKHRHVLSEDLLDGIQGFRRAIEPGTDPRVAGAIACWLHYPEVCREWDKRTRRRVRELVQDTQMKLDPVPSEVYRESLVGLSSMIAALAAGERVRVARVYQQK